MILFGLFLSCYSAKTIQWHNANTCKGKVPIDLLPHFFAKIFCHIATRRRYMKYDPQTDQNMSEIQEQEKSTSKNYVKQTPAENWTNSVKHQKIKDDLLIKNGIS